MNDDELVKAALIEDEEDKRLAAEEAKKSESKSKENPDNEKEDEGKEQPTPPEGKDAPVKSEEKKPEDQADPDEKKDQSQDAEAKKTTDEERQTRKERREQRRKAFIDNIKRDNAPSQNPLPRHEDYKPLDYETAEKPDVTVLQEDRNKFGDNRFADGAQLERYVQSQERFWDNVTYETRILELDPKYSFIREKNADGSENPDFDPDRAETVNELFLEMVGYKETPLFDPKTKQPLIDPQTRQQLVRRSVDRTDISYEKFVREYVNSVELWLDNEVETTNRNLNEQRTHTGIRPGGEARKGLGKLKPGDISKMSQEELEKNEEEIDRQIMAELEG